MYEIACISQKWMAVLLIIDGRQAERLGQAHRPASI